ncbi:MAG: DUF3575 domain-containing protein [Bacteroidales bacterium]
MKKQVFLSILFVLKASFCMVATESYMPEIASSVSFPLAGQSFSKEASIYFHLGSALIDPTLLKNDSSLNMMEQTLKMTLGTDSHYRVDSVVITGSASPLGGETLNRELSKSRAEALAIYLRQKIAIPDSVLFIRSTGANWGELRDMVQASNMRYKKEVLDIIDHVPVDQRRNYVLMDLKWGRPYREMMETFFPKLQNSVTIIVYTTYVPVVPKPEVDPDQFKSVPDEIVPEPVVQEEPVEKAERQPLINLSTNVLYLGALAPNLGVEFCFPQGHWSLNAEVVHPWWQNKPKHKYYQIRQFSGEARYWLNGDGDYRGHFFGAYGNGGVYDLENGGTGYKGNLWGAGATYGYVLRLHPRFRLEFSLGIGYISTKYEQYEPIDNCYVYEKTIRKGYVGPTKVKVGLVWTMVQRNKSGKK